MHLRPILPGIVPSRGLSCLRSHEGGGSFLSHDSRCQNTSQQTRNDHQHALGVDIFVWERKSQNGRKRNGRRAKLPLAAVGTCSFRPKRIGQIRKKERHRQSVKVIATPKLSRRGGIALLADLFLFLVPRVQSSVECHCSLYQRKWNESAYCSAKFSEAVLYVCDAFCDYDDGMLC